jgi:hypothetical protein
MSRVTRANGTDRRGSSAAELTDIGPGSIVTGLDEHELAVLRQVGGHWGRALGPRPAWMRALPIDPGLHRFPGTLPPRRPIASRRSTSSRPATRRKSWPPRTRAREPSSQARAAAARGRHRRRRAGGRPSPARRPGRRWHSRSAPAQRSCSRPRVLRRCADHLVDTHCQAWRREDSAGMDNNAHRASAPDPTPARPTSALNGAVNRAAPVTAPTSVAHNEGPRAADGPMGTAGPADGRATSWTNPTLLATLLACFRGRSRTATRWHWSTRHLEALETRCQRSPDESPKVMDTMQTPIVIELSRMSAHPDAAVASAGMRGPQTWRSVRGSRRGRTNRTPGRPARPGVYTGGRS